MGHVRPALGGTEACRELESGQRGEVLRMARVCVCVCVERDSGEECGVWKERKIKGVLSLPTFIQQGSGH